MSAWEARMMDESATHEAKEPRIKLAAIRAALPPELVEEFWDEIGPAIDEAIERNDPSVIATVKERWWARVQALVDARGLEVKPETDEPLRSFLTPADDEGVR